MYTLTISLLPLAAFFGDISLGPKAVFSSGLYNHMPKSAYSKVLHDVAKKVAIYQPPGRLTRAKFDECCDRHNRATMPLIAHSSIDLSILDSPRLERALLIDPAGAPALSTRGFVANVVTSSAPTAVLLSEGYEDFVIHPMRPTIVGATVYRMNTGGHADILDPPWAWVARRMGIPSDANVSKNYRDEISALLLQWAKLELLQHPQ